LTTQEAGRLGSNDDEQLSYAIEAQKALLTHNRTDFETLVTACSAAAQKHYGIIIAARHDAHELVRRLLLVLNRTTADEMENQVRYL
jgi:tRNA G26 N,N-dimethylase Trm1